MENKIERAREAREYVFMQHEGSIVAVGVYSIFFFVEIGNHRRYTAKTN